MRKFWVLIATVLAEDENEAKRKFTDDIPYMLVNGFDESGNTKLEVKEVWPDRPRLKSW